MPETCPARRLAAARNLGDGLIADLGLLVREPRDALLLNPSPQPGEACIESSMSRIRRVAYRPFHTKPLGQIDCSHLCCTGKFSSHHGWPAPNGPFQCETPGQSEWPEGLIRLLAAASLIAPRTPSARRVPLPPTRLSFAPTRLSPPRPRLSPSPLRLSAPVLGLSRFRRWPSP